MIIIWSLTDFKFWNFFVKGDENELKVVSEKNLVVVKEVLSGRSGKVMGQEACSPSCVGRPCVRPLSTTAQVVQEVPHHRRHLRRLLRPRRNQKLKLELSQLPTIPMSIPNMLWNLHDAILEREKSTIKNLFFSLTISWDRKSFCKRWST